MSSGASQWASERTNERSRASECVRDEQEVRVIELFTFPCHGGTAQWVETVWNCHVELIDMNLFFMSCGKSQWASEQTNDQEVSKKWEQVSSSFFFFRTSTAELLRRSIPPGDNSRTKWEKTLALPTLPNMRPCICKWWINSQSWYANSNIGGILQIFSSEQTR